MKNQYRVTSLKLRIYQTIYIIPVTRTLDQLGGGILFENYRGQEILCLQFFIQNRLQNSFSYYFLAYKIG